jgi:vanadium chloroperoxidase
MATPSAVLYWNEVALQRNVDDHTLPPEFRRAPGPTASAFMLAVVHVAIGDACAAVPEAPYNHLRINAVMPAGADRSAWIGGAAFGALSFIYNDGPQLESLGTARANFFSALGPPPPPPATAPAGWEEGVALGRKVAKALWKREKVVEGIGPDSYVPRRGEHNVDPENPCQGFYGVLWAQSVPAIVQQTNAVPVANEPDERDRDYAEAWREVFVKGNRFSVLDYTRRIVVGSPEEIALFWAYDGARKIGTPPRLYNQNAIAIAKADGLTNSPASDLDWGQLLARFNIALADAGRVCWRAKWARRVWRPVRGIRNPEAIDLPDALLTDAGWVPYGSPRTNRPAPPEPQEVPQFTPNFPAYPSGHATFGAAGFTALRLWREDKRFGGNNGDRLDDIQLESDELNGKSTDHIRPGLKRPLRRRGFDSIGKIIDENSESRIFQGVHWRFDATMGVKSGEEVGEIVHRRAYR